MIGYTPAKNNIQLVQEHSTIVLGITGQMRSGKDTLATFFQYAYRDQTRLVSYATPMKELMIDHLGFTREQLYTQEGKASYNEFWGMTNREALQKVGTDCFRNHFHPHTWLKTMELSIVKELPRMIIIPDVRFPDEAQLVKQFGGYVIKVVRPGMASGSAHVSEQLVDQIPVDLTIVNDQDRASLFYQGLQAVERLGLHARLTLFPIYFFPQVDPDLLAEYRSACCRFYPMLDDDK